MDTETAKKLLRSNFFNSLQHKIPKAVQNDPDFQVYACDELNEMVAAAKELDEMYGGRRMSGVSPLEVENLIDYVDSVKVFLEEEYWEEKFAAVERFVLDNLAFVESQPSIAGALFIRAVEVARTDSLKLLFKMSTTI